MALLLLILFIAIPIAELFVIIKVGEAIGVWPTIALLIADSILGVLLLRHQGRSAWRRFTLALEQSRLPHREVFDGAMVILGGALLLTPGFITDFFGIFCLLPPTRAVLWRLMKAGVLKRLTFVPTVAYGGYRAARGRRGSSAGGPGPARPPAGPQPGDIEGTAEEVTENGADTLPAGDPSDPRDQGTSP